MSFFSIVDRYEYLKIPEYMCFSPEASFLTSAGLIGVGIATVRTASKKEKFLAAIPFLFAFQQAAEGVQWLAIDQGTVFLPAAYVFLFFALLLWPTAVPAVVYYFDTKARFLVRWFLLLGICTSFYLLSVLISHKVDVGEVGRSLHYGFGMQRNPILVFLYLVSVAGPLVCSSIRQFQIFAIIGIIAFIVSQIFYSITFISVWCFFAAVMSSLVYLYVHRSVVSQQ